MRIFIAGLTSKKLLVSLFLLFLAGTVFAVDVKLTAPQFTSDNPEIEVWLDALNQDLLNYFKEFETIESDINNVLPDNFNKLAGGFANASVFSSDGASQRGYEGYKAFSLTFGPIIAVQLPQLTLFDKITDVINNGEEEISPDFIKDLVNIPFGFNFQALNAQLGINTSFLLKGLYLGFNFSMFDTNWINAIAMNLPGFSFKTMSVGINASYQLISQKRLLAGLLVWRGLNLGAGFIWHKTSLELKSDLGDIFGEDSKNIQIPLPLPAELGGERTIDMPLVGSLQLGFDTNTYIIPVKAITSIRLLGFLNVALGAGIDIALPFGGSSIEAKGSFTGDKDNVTGLPYGIIVDQAPSLTFSLGGKSAPSFFNPKVMGAVGFNFGPLIIDIPLTYYFKDNGYSLGFTLGLSL